MDEDERILTPGFRLLLDITASAIGAGLAYGLMVSGDPGSSYWVDLAYSILLLLVGLLSGTPLFLVIVSSIPVSLWRLLEFNAPLFDGVLASLIVRVFRGVWGVHSLARGMSRLGRLIDTLLIQAGILATIALLGGTLGLYIVESGSGGGVDSVWDAFWLALVTITTVGYGDLVPSTEAGRAIASLLMLVGIGLFTFFLSSLAAGISRIAAIDERPQTAMERRKSIIIQMIRNIEELNEEEYRNLRIQLDLLYLLAKAEDKPLEELKQAIAS